MLESREIADQLKQAERDIHSFSEWDHIYEGPELVELEHLGQGRIVLYGRRGSVFSLHEKSYWDCFAEGRGGSTGQRCKAKDWADPYESQDGGRPAAMMSYMGVTWGPYKYTALMYWLLPALRELWTSDLLLRYVDRVQELGVRMKPDRCAPVGPASEYGSTWGPDSKRPQSCIRGTGRWPAEHGRDLNLGGGATRVRPFGQRMWEAYRACAQDCSCPGMQHLCRAPEPSDAANSMPGVGSEVQHEE